MGHLGRRVPLSSTISSSSAPLQDDFARLPMTPPEPADAVLPAPKDAAAVSAAIHVISTERAALTHLEHLYQTDQLAQNNLARAVGNIARTIRNGNKLVCCGVGKSGKIAQKLEATMNSLGIHSMFLHPTEALHGDLGMIRPNDTLLLISFSGRTPELLLMLPHIPSTVTVIAITSHLHPSTCPLLSFHPSDMVILLPSPIHEDEETSIGIGAPTSSTTVALSLGDALAIATARKLHSSPGRGPADIFKSYHPGGAIGTALTASTPMSMSNASITSTPSDFLRVRQPISPFTNTQEFPGGPLIIDLITPLDQVPTVVSTGKVRLLDVLLTAIQHPSAKSWVFVSPTEIIPPRQLRFLSQGSYIDMDISSLADLGASYLVPQKDWLLIPESCTIEAARNLVPAGSSSPVMVIGVTRSTDSTECIGVFEAEDLWSNCDG
ncbi:uncharacterized protein BJX67DRAFT_279604 [Aspergillus lucknowensis]|uniref:SIS domain-containing protein n=1 Tax=Aspergillus lucknowensis TaxID=176173 RepID=A0ABR4M0G4_9EURO